MLSPQRFLLAGMAIFGGGCLLPSNNEHAGEEAPGRTTGSEGLTAATDRSSGDAAATFVIGVVRISVLSPTLVRLEQQGPKGFEDRNTFHIVERRWPGAPVQFLPGDQETRLATAHFVVRVPTAATSLQGVSIESLTGETLYRWEGELSQRQWLPAPASRPRVFSIADRPRLVPPAWGATPAVDERLFPASSGWDLGNDAPDVYVFLPGGDHQVLRREFLRLTGPTEMIPLYALGAFDSRWYPYTEETALRQIDDYRSRGIPLDVLVVDTDWRIGASHGYQPNPDYFPDVERFLRRAHEKHVRVMFNDHPEPRARHALEPAELRFRWEGLAGLLERGLDLWWYDRNWSTHLTEPLPGLNREVWGMQLYHDITQRARPGQRPLLMANVDGIDSGEQRHAPDMAAHRFPIQWTGDTHSEWRYLRLGVENAVHAGVHALFGFMSEDLGGFNGHPSREQYVRWLQYGAFSPVYRTHCTRGEERMPWRFDAEELARDYLRMRYRLLPTWYAAARANHLLGEPLLRRLDLDFPEYAEAQRNDQYLVGRALLVAPIVDGPDAASSQRQVWIPPGNWIEAWTGRVFTGPALQQIEASLAQIPLWILAGSVVLLAPEVQFTGERPWDPITIDVYPASRVTAQATLYEDDGLSTEHLQGRFRETRIAARLELASRQLHVDMGPAQGQPFAGAFLERRWKVRVHAPVELSAGSPREVLLDGSPISSWKILPCDPQALPFAVEGGAPDGEVLEISIPSGLVEIGHSLRVTY